MALMHSALCGHLRILPFPDKIVLSRGGLLAVDGRNSGKVSSIVVQHSRRSSKLTFENVSGEMQLLRKRVLRDTLVLALTSILQPPQTTLLSARALVDAASILRASAQEPCELTPASQKKLVATTVCLLAALDPAAAASAAVNIGVMLSSLRDALECSRLDRDEVTGDAALQQQDGLEASVLALTQKAVASHSAGQQAIMVPFDNFAIYGRVLSVERSGEGGRGGGGGGGGKMARLRTKGSVQMGGFYSEWEQNQVVVSMPDVTVRDSKVVEPAEGGAAAVVLIVTAWRANASWVRAAIVSQGRAALAGPLLGQYVSVSLKWHGREGAEAAVALESLPVPVRLGLRATVPNVTEDSVTGRHSNVATCVYLAGGARAWDMDGMSLALNSSSGSNFSKASSAVDAGTLYSSSCLPCVLDPKENSS